MRVKTEIRYSITSVKTAILTKKLKNRKIPSCNGSKLLEVQFVADYMCVCTAVKKKQPNESLREREFWIQESSSKVPSPKN